MVWFPKRMNEKLYRAIQCTWGLPQTLAGLGVYLAHARCPHSEFHGAVVTEWPNRSGLSLGMFLFVPDTADEQLLVHEFGHSAQSLALGPLYLLAVGLPSVTWAKCPPVVRWRCARNIPYYTFLPERNASALGSRILHCRTL